MAEHQVEFDSAKGPVSVQTGTLLTEAARQAGVEITQPCGGQGRCGRCLVRVTDGQVRRRSTLRLSEADLEMGYALACQSVVEGQVAVAVPPQEKVERRLSTDRMAAEVTVPLGYSYETDQSIKRLCISLTPPSMEDQTDDWGRLEAAIKRALKVSYSDKHVEVTLANLRKIGQTLRDGDWDVTAYLSIHPKTSGLDDIRLIDLQPGHVDESSPIWGIAVDIGTTTVTVWLVDLLTGQVAVQMAEYNGQISRGEDVISRIIYASKNAAGGQEMRELVLGTINQLVNRACKRAKIQTHEIVKGVIAGNSTMMHLLLGLPGATIRLMPFVTAVNALPRLGSKDIGLNIHPEAVVDCLPGVASYVGADITAGVLSSGVDDSAQVSLFLDIGTNGETVLGSQEWLVTCACSAGPAFEGAGVLHGMRATRGAIEEVWINSSTFEPVYRVIGESKPRGLCGSGLISLLAELFLTGVLDKGGNFNATLATDRVRRGEHGLEYVVAWGEETKQGRDIVITRVDVDNLLRAKAAIFAGFTVLAESVGFSLDDVERVLIGGAFGKYINVEKAVEIGLLPDMPWDRFDFLGNTAVRGAYFALLDRKMRDRIQDIASKMTYIELSADNSFYDAFTSALFLPHTDMTLFPTVAEQLGQLEESPRPI